MEKKEMKKPFPPKHPHNSGNQLTVDFLKKHCKYSGGYDTLKYNESLYLNKIGLKTLDNFDKFPDLKLLYLDGNGIENLNSLKYLKNLRHLYARHNYIESFEGVEDLILLDTLSLSGNRIKTISGIQKLKSLTRLDLSDNILESFEDVQELEFNVSLRLFGIQDNPLDFDDRILTLFSSMESLKGLMMNKTNFKNECVDYRKTVIYHVKTLVHFDGNDVSELERVSVDAYFEKSEVEAKKEIENYLKKKKAEKDEQLKEMLEPYRNVNKGKITGKKSALELELEAKFKRKMEVESKLL